MKRPLAFLLLLIALAWLLHFEQSYLTGGAVSEESAVCDNGICEVGEDNNGCPEDCPNPVCGNNVVEEKEECDGIDDSLCPELCQHDCSCPPAEQRNVTTVPYTYSFSYDELAPNEVFTINLGRPRVDIQGISVIASETIQNPKFVIVSSVSAPPDKPKGLAHAYFQVNMANLSQEQYVAHKEIFFRVPTDWIIENNVKTITLEKAGAVWETIGTEKLYQDMDYIYFSAKPKEFGLFATVSPPEPEKPKPVCGNGIVEENETAETCCADAGCLQNQSCISNQCRIVAICGNNICELSENANDCPADCAAVKFRPSTAPALVLMLAVLVTVAIFLMRKFPELYKKSVRVKEKHATPERWS